MDENDRPTRLPLAAAVNAQIDAYLASQGGRRLADAEWGLTLPAETAAGHPLDIGIRAADGLLRIQAFAVPAADAPADADALHWNRRTRLVRFARTRGGDLWVQADLPLELVDETQLDRLLGLVVEAARTARAAG